MNISYMNIENIHSISAFRWTATTVIRTVLTSSFAKTLVVALLIKTLFFATARHFLCTLEGKKAGQKQLIRRWEETLQKICKSNLCLSRRYVVAILKRKPGSVKHGDNMVTGKCKTNQWGWGVVLTWYIGYPRHRFGQITSKILPTSLPFTYQQVVITF